MNTSNALRGRVLRAVGAEGLGQLLNIAIRLLLVPLFLSAWGTESYGEWLILTAVASWFSLADLGAQLYFVNKMTEAWAKTDLNEFQLIFSTGLFFFSTFSCVLMIITSATLLLSDPSRLLAIQHTPSSVVCSVLLISSFRMLASLPLGLLLGVYRAIGAQATSVMYGNLMLAMQLVAATVVLWYGGNMVLMALTEVIALLLTYPLVISNLRARMPEQLPLYGAWQPNIQILRKAWRPSMHFLSIQLAMAAMTQGCIIVLAKAMGPLEVAIFSTMRTIANVVSRFLGMLSHAAWAEFTRLEAKNEFENLQKLFCSILFFSTAAGLSYLTLMDFFGDQIFELWLNKQLPYERLSMTLMGVLIVFTNSWTLGGSMLMATNRHSSYAKVQLPVNVAALIIAYFGGYHFELEGFIVGLIIGQALPMTIITAWILKNNQWTKSSKYLLGLSSGLGLLLPFYLDPLTGLAATAFATLFAIVFFLKNKTSKYS